MPRCTIVEREPGERWLQSYAQSMGMGTFSYTQLLVGSLAYEIHVQNCPNCKERDDGRQSNSDSAN